MKLYNESNLQDKIGYVVCDVDTKNLEKIMDKYRIDRTAFMWLQPTGDRPIDTLGDLDAEQLKMKPIQNRNFSVLISNIII